ncbi:MAG: CvpA family protein [Opitutaceae bacterium]|nr:CvpA family protein [Verrucomicrobiales bacterium]
MLLWIIALVTLGLVGVVGYYAGAIRVTFSFVGLFLASALAFPLSPMIRPVVAAVGVKQTVIQQIISPVVVFILVMIIVKIIAAVVHQKIDLYYKYKREDEERFAWQRLNQCLGFCLGLVNGAIYFVLLMIPIYISGYFTYYFVPADTNSPVLRFLNSAGADLRNSKFDRVLAKYDPVPTPVYDATEIIALIYKNPLSEHRLTRYPAFVSIGEKPEFQAIASDIDLHNKWQSGGKATDLLKHPRIVAVLDNNDLTTEIMRVIGENLKDLRQFIETGKSEKYDEEKILGQWNVDVAGTIVGEKIKRPNVSSLELSRLKQNIMSTYSSASLVATIDNRVVLKSAPDAASQLRKVISQGTWKKESDVYRVTLAGQTGDAVIANDGSRMSMTLSGLTVLLDRED